MMKRNGKACVYVVRSLQHCQNQAQDSLPGWLAGWLRTVRKQLRPQSARGTCCKYIPACNSITCLTRKWKLLLQWIPLSKSVSWAFSIRLKERAQRCLLAPTCSRSTRGSSKCITSGTGRSFKSHCHRYVQVNQAWLVKWLHVHIPGAPVLVPPADRSNGNMWFGTWRRHYAICWKYRPMRLLQSGLYTEELHFPKPENEQPYRDTTGRCCTKGTNLPAQNSSAFTKLAKPNGSFQIRKTKFWHLTC